MAKKKQNKTEVSKDDLVKVAVKEAIDSLLLPDLFKWKVAFLYSNERLTPIYKKDVLFKIASSLKLATDKNTKISPYSVTWLFLLK
ncbi:MAG: hypothetical protein ACE5KZ_15430 [Candidatus Scalinduaceae bacterium]